MKANERERAEFISRLTRELPDLAPHLVVDLARKLMRAETTLQRLAEAQCNGDWPADNGERAVKTCPRCESCWVASVLKPCKDFGPARYCVECRTEWRVNNLARAYGIVPVFQGDPRGAVLKLKLPSGYTNDVSREGICVP